MTSSTSLPEDGRQRRRASPGSYYGHGIPYLPIEGYPGKIIAIEGTDGVGRSTQIALLREWLEVQGYGVIETGWTRSELMPPTIELAKSSNTLNKLTFVLLYAPTSPIGSRRRSSRRSRPASSCSSDRYIYTAHGARRRARRRQHVDPAASTASRIAPHLVFYLKIDEKTLIRRVLQSRGMDYWESGMDMKLGDDIYESFRAYQRALLQGVRVDGRRVRLPGARRAPQGRRHPGRAAPPDRRVPGRDRDAAPSRDGRVPAAPTALFTRNLHRAKLRAKLPRDTAERAGMSAAADDAAAAAADRHRPAAERRSAATIRSRSTSRT